MLAVDNEKPKLANHLKIPLRHNTEISLSCSFILYVCTYGYVNQNNDVVIMQIYELIAWQSGMPPEYLNAFILHSKKFVFIVCTYQTSDENSEVLDPGGGKKEK